jgi:hypothetical protein
VARDSLGRWLPGPVTEDDGRHYFTQADRRKGYLVATRLAGMPSRVRSWLRTKLRHSLAAKERS